MYHTHVSYIYILYIYIRIVYTHMTSYKCIINYNYTFWSVCANRVFPSARIGSILAQVLSWDGQEMFISFLPRKFIGNIWKSHEQNPWKLMKTYGNDLYHLLIWTWLSFWSMFFPPELSHRQFLPSNSSFRFTTANDVFSCLIFVTEIDNLPNGKPGI